MPNTPTNKPIGLPLKDEAILERVLGQTAPGNGLTIDCCEGLISGAVAGLRACGLSYNDAIKSVVKYLPSGSRIVVPADWGDDLVAELRAKGVDVEVDHA